MQVAVIINPRSGTRRGASAAAERTSLARAVMQSHGASAEIHVTEGPGHAAALARGAAERGAGLVCAWGGDGTVNEVASALAFGPTALGIVPSGSGNGFARALRVPADPAAALRHALACRERFVDAGILGDRLFVNVAGVGLDARVAFRFARHGRRRGPLPYAWHTAAELLRSAAAEYDLDIEGERVVRRVLVLALANSREYGNRAVIAPHAEVDDGALDLVLIDPMPVFRLLTDLPRLFTGRADGSRAVRTRRIRRLRVSCREPIPFHVDGEPVLGGTCLEARVLPAALRIRA
jgi:diacylglycerol kinase (ATP)